MEFRQSDLNFVYSRIPQDVRRFMVEGRVLMLAGGFIRSVIEGFFRSYREGNAWDEAEREVEEDYNADN